MLRFPNGLLKPVFVIQKNKEAHSEPFQTSKMELFVKIVEGGWQLAKFAKNSCQGSDWVLAGL